MTESFNLPRADQGPPLQKLIVFLETELAANRNDTIHDFLAYLAGQMIEMHKVKNEEIKGFLIWLERQLKFSKVIRSRNLSSVLSIADQK